MTQREQMEKAIKSGSGVLYSGRIITQLEHLPTDAELAANDSKKVGSRKDEIKAEIEVLQRELDRLEVAERPAGLPASGATADAPAPAGVKAPSEEAKPEPAAETPTAGAKSK